MQDIIIRFAKDYDIEEMAEIHAFGKKEAYAGIIDDSYLDRAINDNDYRLDQMLQRYGSRNSLIAEQDGAVVGFIQWVFGNESSGLGYAMSEVCSLYIHPQHKGLGIGSMLLERVKMLCKSAGCNNMQLYCLEQNVSAVNFYKKHDGTIINRTMLKFDEKEYPAFVFLFNL